MFLGFMQIHILIQARKEPFFGLGMIGEMEKLGYPLSPGTLYPLLAKLQQEGLLTKETRVINGKSRYYYGITEQGIEVLNVAKSKAMVLLDQLSEV